MTTLTHADFLAAIIADPASDGPRLVYADWLEEQGECDRAEFIRVQCELANLLSTTDNVGDRFNPKVLIQRDALRRRERELLREHWNEWTYGLAPHSAGGRVTSGSAEVERNLIGGSPVVWQFRRGFVAAVRCRLSDWIGVACERCGGRGNLEASEVRPWNVSPYSLETRWGYEECRHCRGTGRTGSIGPALVRRCPLEELRFVDREPYHQEGIGEWMPRWGWLTSGPNVPQMAPAQYLPSVLYDLLTDCIPHVAPGRWYDSPDLAHAAAGAAGLRWAKAQPEG